VEDAISGVLANHETHKFSAVRYETAMRIAEAPTNLGNHTMSRIMYASDVSPTSIANCRVRIANVLRASGIERVI
jgi:hypothetical protein